MELHEILSDAEKKEYAIREMAKTILNEDLTSNDALNRDLWLIRFEINENEMDKYFGRFPEDMKERAIMLAEEKKKKQTIAGFHDDYVVTEMVNQILKENIRATEALKKKWIISGTDINNKHKVYDGNIPEELVLRALSIVKKRREKMNQ
jgi:hypothetical protein